MEKIIVNSTLLIALLGDITDESADAIVNAANSSLMGGGGVDGAIHRAGGPAILDECKRIVAKMGRLPAGRAVITGGGRLKAKYVIHTVGPVWHGGNAKEPEILASCYTESLKLAVSNNIKTIAFPAISTGVYGYPAQLAANTALNAVADFLRKEKSQLEQVRFVLYDRDSYTIYLKELDNLANKYSI